MMLFELGRLGSEGPPFGQDRLRTTCSLCGEAKETAAHTVWTCKALHAERCEADKLLAECCGEANLPAAVQHGIAPAMRAKPDGIFYGDVPAEWTKELKKLFGTGLAKYRLKLGKF